MGWVLIIAIVFIGAFLFLRRIYTGKGEKSEAASQGQSDEQANGAAETEAEE